MLVDSHCHLDFPDFAEDLDAIVARAETAGIGRIVTISTRVKRLGGLIAIAERFPPTEIASFLRHREASWARQTTSANQPRFQ